MLYITTRNKMDSYTAYRALRAGFSDDGGQFIPLRLPKFDSTQIAAMQDQSFNEIVANVLNLFFTAHLTGWDVEFAVGRKPFKIVDMGRKTVVAELWRNTEGSFQAVSNRLFDRLCDNKATNMSPVGWADIAIRIAFVFGIYGELSRMGIQELDASAYGKDMNTAIAFWYAGQMGLPVGKIICGTNENCWTWDLLHKGEVGLFDGIKTSTPALDTIPNGLERLIYSALGPVETSKYLAAMNGKSYYKVSADMQSKLSQGLFVAVVGQQRVKDIIGSIYRTNTYLLDPYTAISYGALQDFRAKTGENRVTLMLTEENPVRYSDLLADATGLSEQAIYKQ